MKFWETVRRDFHHHIDSPFYTDPKKVTFVKVLRAAIEPEFRIVFAYRVYSHLLNGGHTLLSYLIYIRTKAVTRCDIAREATIGAGLKISHPFDIVIGPDARIGDDAVIFNGVTIGNRLSRDHWTGMPEIGKSVLIGSGAKIVGPITIGDNARIGANAVVLRDVPASGTAVGNPARIIDGNGRHNSG